MTRPILSIEPYTDLRAALARCIALRRQRPVVEASVGVCGSGYLVVSIHGRETLAPWGLGGLGRGTWRKRWASWWGEWCEAWNREPPRYF